jgi:hypothetical protein
MVMRKEEGIPASSSEVVDAADEIDEEMPNQ